MRRAGTVPYQQIGKDKAAVMMAQKLCRSENRDRILPPVAEDDRIRGKTHAPSLKIRRHAPYHKGEV